MAKYDKDLDRQAILFDYKNRLIDLLENNQPLPEVDIYDEPVRYFKANEQWCKVIFGWLTHYQLESGWKDAEDTNYAGIQALLIFEEGINMTMAQDIRDGIYQAVNDIAKQIISGRITDIVVGEDGTVTGPTDSPAADVPADDPDTPDFDERQAAISGAAIAVSLGVSEFLTYVSTLFGADTTPDTTLADAQYLVGAKYSTNQPLMDTAISNMWTARAAGTTTINSLDREDLAQEIYCTPYGDYWDRVLAFVVKLVTPTAAQKKLCTDLINGLEEDQWSRWYLVGNDSPSTEYLDYSCVPSPDDNLSITVLGTTYTSLIQWKPNHRLRLTVTGFLTDPTGRQRDFLYSKTSAGVVSSAIASLSLFVGSAVTKPTTTQCPYNLTGSYTFTVDVALNSAMAITVNTFGTWGLPATGTISVLIEDMGQVL